MPIPMFDLWSALRVLLEWQLQSCLQNCNTGQCQSGYFDGICFLSCVVLAQKICILNCLLKLDAHCPSQMFDLDFSVSLAGVAIVVELLAEQCCHRVDVVMISLFFQLKTCEKSLRRGLISPRSSPHSRHQRLKGQENEFFPTTTTYTALNLLPH